MPSQLNKLIQQLQHLNAEVNAEDIADWLWLAAHKAQYAQQLGRTPTQTQEDSRLPDFNANQATDLPKLEPQAPASPKPTAPKDKRQADLHIRQDSGQTATPEETAANSLPFRTPAASALPHSLQLSRILRPLMRRLASGDAVEIDEQATAQQIANTGIWLPVMRPQTVRWLDLLLVVEDSPSMRLWHHTVKELQQLLERQGAFSDVRVWRIKTSAHSTDVSLHSHKGEAARHYKELLNPAQRRLILLVSDGISPAWQGETLLNWLDAWGRQHPVTLLNLLPQSLWSQTRLRTARLVKLNSRMAANANVCLQQQQTLPSWIKKSDTKEGEIKKPEIEYLPVPLTTLEPDFLAHWVKFMTGDAKTIMPGFIFKATTNLPESEASSALDETQLFRRFRSAASPTAFQLACYLAAAPLLLPIMRLVQRVMLPQSEQVHLAEVFLSGLIKRVGDDNVHPDKIAYDFLNTALRDKFLDAGLVTDAVQVQEAISGYIADHYGCPLDFQAMLANPDVVETWGLTDKHLVFAKVAATVLRRLGGRYEGVADMLEKPRKYMFEILSLSDDIVMPHQGTGNIAVGKLDDIPRHLTATPFIPDVFQGREVDLTAIRTKLEISKQPLLLVNGQGGIGKTSLAAKYWQVYQDYYVHTAWLYASCGLNDALLMLALPLQVSFPDAMPTAQRLVVLQAAVANLNAPCLLIIDNANNAEELAQHWGFLRACNNCHILLTSRLNKFNGADHYPIAALPEAVALNVFNSHYPQHRSEDDGLFFRIYQAVGGNTLVLELLAKNLAAVNANKMFYPLSQLLADMQQKGLLRLAKTKTVNVMGKGVLPALQAANPTAIIAALYDELEQITPLNEAEQRLLCNLAVLPAENWAYSDLADLLLSPEEDDEEIFSDTLSGLAARGWLENSVQNGISHYKTSPVVQEITRHKNAERLQGYCADLVNKLTDKLAYETDSGHLLNASYADAAAYCRHAETITVWLPRDHNLAVLHERIGSYHLTTGNLDKALRAFTDEHNIMAALQRREPDNLDVKNSLAVACQYLGNTHTTLGNLQQSLHWREEDYRLSKELYAAAPSHLEFKNGLAVACSKLGITHITLGDLQQALRWYEEFHHLAQELHAAAPGHLGFKDGLAVACQHLGNTHTTLGDLQQALRWYEEYHRLKQELHAAAPGHLGFKNGLAVACQHLGNAHTTLGDLQQALRWYEEFHHLAQELHAAAPDHLGFANSLAVALMKLGGHYEQQGNIPLALDYYRQAQALLAELVSKSTLYVEFKERLAWVNGRLGILEI